MSKINVYDLKQAEKENGKWNKKDSQTQREGMKVSKKDADDYNKNFKNSGRYYQLNRRATTRYDKMVAVKKAGESFEEE